MGWLLMVPAFALGTMNVRLWPHGAIVILATAAALVIGGLLFVDPAQITALGLAANFLIRLVMAASVFGVGKLIAKLTARD